MVEITSVLGLLSVGLFSIFLILSGVTIAYSITQKRSDKSSARRRDLVRNDLLEMLESSNPDLDSWITSISASELEALESVLDHYLRLVEGSQRDRLLEIASRSGIGEKADHTLDRSAIVPRLQALATLAILDYPITIERIVATCSDSRLTREAAARLLYERRDEFENPTERGTDLLLWEGQEPMTIYGLDTLMELNTGDRTPLLPKASESASEWSQAVLVQVCLVIEHAEIVDPEAPLDWLFPLLTHNEPVIREAAIRSFKQHGWQTPLRKRIDFEKLISDDAPQVRRATYTVLSYWGDDGARKLLQQAVLTEENERCQMVAVRGLNSLDIDPQRTSEGWPEEVWEWIQAEIDVIEHRLLGPGELEHLP